jgi:hypothetical protein
VGIWGQRRDIVQPGGDLKQGESILGIDLQAALQEAPPLRLAAAGNFRPQPTKLQPNNFKTLKMFPYAESSRYGCTSIYKKSGLDSRAA